MERETRPFVCSLGIEKRAEGEGLPVINGHAAVFDTLSEDLGGFREIIRPGAFRQALNEEQDVRALVDHDPAKILGRPKADTLTLSEDGVGLRVKIHPPDTSAGRDIVESIGRRDVDSMSFAFSVRDGGEEFTDMDGELVRVLTDLDLFDVSPVTFASYRNTDVGVAVRHLDGWLNKHPVIEGTGTARVEWCGVHDGCKVFRRHNSGADRDALDLSLYLETM